MPQDLRDAIESFDKSFDLLVRRFGVFFERDGFGHAREGSSAICKLVRPVKSNSRSESSQPSHRPGAMPKCRYHSRPLSPLLSKNAFSTPRSAELNRISWTS